MAKKILIIEDEQTITKALMSSLKEADGYKLEAAVDGEEGLEKINNFKPDLIILDLILPKLDGFSILKKIKENDDTKNIPVLVLTNLSDVTDKVKQLGGEDCLIKADYSMAEIHEKIKKQLG